MEQNAQEIIMIKAWISGIQYYESSSIKTGPSSNRALQFPIKTKTNRAHFLLAVIALSPKFPVPGTINWNAKQQ